MKKLLTHLWMLPAMLVMIALFGCDEQMPDATALSATVTCDADNGGLTLPDGFCAVLVVDTLGRARHLTVRDNGDIYVALRQPTDEGSIAALRDTTGDGRANVVAFFGEDGGTGIHLRGDYLYFAPDTMIMRYPLAADALLPAGAPETVVSGFSRQGSHAVKPFEFDDQGAMYVNVGAPSNACQDPSRQPGIPGQDPCPLLENYGGVWRFQADELGQTKDGDGYRYATGIRNGVANAWNPGTGKLYVAQHGRDALHGFWPDHYTEEQNNELPSEELFVVEDGSDFGWPYCYFDHVQGKKLLNPEYGGDGQEVGRCAEAADPLLAFPGHWAPNDLLFYSEGHFPDRYQGGAFIAFHGSWNRTVQQGYRVVFVPFEGESVAGEYETFADGFAGTDSLTAPGMAQSRPMGLATGPDGSLYITDSRRGRVWRVIYRES